MRHRAAFLLCRTLLLCGSLMLLLGCSRKPEPTAPVRGGTLRVAIFEALDLPSPLYGMQPATSHFVEHVTPPLGRIDPQGTVRFLLAKEFIDTGGRIDYTLQPRRWEDGVAVTPADIAITARLLRIRGCRARTAIAPTSSRIASPPTIRRCASSSECCTTGGYATPC
jgi:hypothetical protein